MAVCYAFRVRSSVDGGSAWNEVVENTLIQQAPTVYVSELASTTAPASSHRLSDFSWPSAVKSESVSGWYLDLFFWMTTTDDNWKCCFGHSISQVTCWSPVSPLHNSLVRHWSRHEPIYIANIMIHHIGIVWRIAISRYLLNYWRSTFTLL